MEEYPEKGFAEGRKIGLIAQDAEQVIPEVVSTDNEGYKSAQKKWGQVFYYKVFLI